VRNTEENTLTNEIPKPGQWWQHDGSAMSRLWRMEAPRFIIDDVVIKEPLEESWVIYSNDDGLDYFVVVLWEFQREWSKVNG
jgi:hypothetical protein